MEKNVSVGRRKASIARVHVSSGKGKIVINGKKLEEYFPQYKGSFPNHRVKAILNRKVQGLH